MHRNTTRGGFEPTDPLLFLIADDGRYALGSRSSARRRGARKATVSPSAASIAATLGGGLGVCRERGGGVLVLLRPHGTALAIDNRTLYCRGADLGSGFAGSEGRGLPSPQLSPLLLATIGAMGAAAPGVGGNGANDIARRRRSSAGALVGPTHHRQG